MCTPDADHEVTSWLLTVFPCVSCRSWMLEHCSTTEERLINNTLEKSLEGESHITFLFCLNELKRLVRSSVPLNCGTDTSWVQSSGISSIRARRCANALSLRSNCKSFREGCQSQRWRLEETVTHSGGWALSSLKADFSRLGHSFQQAQRSERNICTYASVKVCCFRQIPAWSWFFWSPFPASSYITGKVRTSCLSPVIDGLKRTHLPSDKCPLQHFTDGQKLRLCWDLTFSPNIMWMTKWG